MHNWIEIFFSVYKIDIEKSHCKYIIILTKFKVQILISHIINQIEGNDISFVLVMLECKCNLWI